MNTEKLITIAKETLSIEIDGLKLLCNTINDSFINAVNIIFNTKGKVVVSGVGKSGHVGRKMAATFASTGTPAFFVHPTEALHGDLGMISTNDCIIIISNSGNSLELNGVVEYCLTQNIPIIAITNNLNSSLAKASNALLLLPQAKEACPFNMAPTTSTTLTMALGDCLAVTLLKLKNFSCENFKVFHPGGSLGSSLKRLSDIMHKGAELPIISSGTKMLEALLIITSKRFGCVAVVNNANSMIGIITDGDLRRHLSSNILDLPVEKVMTKTFSYLRKDNFAAEALALMNNKKITNLFILNDNLTPIGVVHIHDFANIR